MSEERTQSLGAMLASLTSSGTAIGKKAIMIDSSGTLSKEANVCGFYDLKNAETAGATLTLKEFTAKYIYPTKPGDVLTDSLNSLAEKWNIKLTDSLTVSPQDYLILVTKRMGVLTTAWRMITFVMLPARGAVDEIYLVSQLTGASASEYTTTIKKIALTSI